MNSNNDTNRNNKIEGAAIAAGALIALTSLLPMTAQAAQTKTKHTKHAATVHHVIRRHTTRRIAAARPKTITIHGYASTHPYSQAAYDRSAYINVSTGRTATVSSSEMPGQRWYPEGHSGPGGIIETDGSLSAFEPVVDLRHAPPYPDYGAAPGIIQYPPYSFVGADNVGGFGYLDPIGGYGNVLIPTTPAVPIITPVVPTVPVVPAVPATTPVVP